MLKTASSRLTSLFNTDLASAVAILCSGMNRTACISGGMLMGAVNSCCPSLTTSCNPPSTDAATLSGCPSIVAAISSNSLGLKSWEHISFAATNPPDMAAALLPNPLAKGISLWQRIRTGGISRSASLKRKAIAWWTRLSSPVPSSPAPSPLISTTDPLLSMDGPEVTSIRFHRSRAIPRQSNPGPRLAVVAGARTPMGSIIALDSMRAPARRRNGPGPCFP